MQGSVNYCPQAKSSLLPIFMWLQTRSIFFYIFLTIEENEKKKFHDMRTLYKIQILLSQIVLNSPTETQQHTHWLMHCLWMFLNL